MCFVDLTKKHTRYTIRSTGISRRPCSLGSAYHQKVLAGFARLPRWNASGARTRTGDGEMFGLVRRGAGLRQRSVPAPLLCNMFRTSVQRVAVARISANADVVKDKVRKKGEYE